MINIALAYDCKHYQVDKEVEVCVPGIKEDCQMVKVKSLKIQPKEQCVDTARTVCTVEKKREHYNFINQDNNTIGRLI